MDIYDNIKNLTDENENLKKRIKYLQSNIEVLESRISSMNEGTNEEDIHPDIIDEIVSSINQNEYEGSFAIECGDGIERGVEWSLKMEICEQE